MLTTWKHSTLKVKKKKLQDLFVVIIVAVVVVSCPFTQKNLHCFFFSISFGIMLYDVDFVEDFDLSLLKNCCSLIVIQIVRHRQFIRVYLKYKCTGPHRQSTVYRFAGFLFCVCVCSMYYVLCVFVQKIDKTYRKTTIHIKNNTNFPNSLDAALLYAWRRCTHNYMNTFGIQIREKKEEKKKNKNTQIPVMHKSTKPPLAVSL